MSAQHWIKLNIELSKADDILVGASGSRGEYTSHEASASVFGRLEEFTNVVQKACSHQQPLDDQILAEAANLFESIFGAGIISILARLVEASKDEPILVQLLLNDTRLQAIAWEALCLPDGHAQFWGLSPRYALVRGVQSTSPALAREMTGAVRILVIAPLSSAASIAPLEQALGQSIAKGELEWLEPILGTEATPSMLARQIERRGHPHIIHYLGHGTIDDKTQRPMLQLANEDGEASWIEVDALITQLDPGPYLRLVVLESCEGARPEPFGSAAERLAQNGPYAVVAHLWQVEAAIAQRCSTTFYRTLTESTAKTGDVEASLKAARRQLAANGAAAFSPVLYLRGNDTALFEFKSRNVTPPKARIGNLDPVLQSLLGNRFSLVLGDHGSTSDRNELQAKLTHYLREHDDPVNDHMPITALAERCALRFGQRQLDWIFHDVVSRQSSNTEPHAVINALGLLLPPGVHVTLLWLPLLERAVAERQPHRTIYTIRPQLKRDQWMYEPFVARRAAGEVKWEHDLSLSQPFNFKEDIVILRLCGGYSPDVGPAPTDALVTEDDYLYGFFGMDTRQDTWANALMGHLRATPGLLIGLSALKWRHRMLLGWLYDHRAAPDKSLVLLEQSVKLAEADVWRKGAGLSKGMTTLLADPQLLGENLEAFARTRGIMQ